LSLTDTREGLRNLGRANPHYIEYMHDGSTDFSPMLITGLAKGSPLGDFARCE
jgi:hypothetical protein